MLAKPQATDLAVEPVRVGGVAVVVVGAHELLLAVVALLVVVVEPGQAVPRGTEMGRLVYLCKKKTQLF